MKYKIFGLVIDIDTPLPCLENGLSLEVEQPSAIQIRRTPPISVDEESGWQLKGTVLADPRGKFWSLYRKGCWYLINYEGLLKFVVDARSQDIFYWVGRDDLDLFFEWTLLHLAVPLALHLREVPVYHAGGVCIGSGALALVGHSGLGKSTLTAAFGRAGYPVLTDDLLAIDERNGTYYAAPSFPWVRLCRESVDALFDNGVLDSVPEDGDGKFRVGPEMDLLPFATQSRPLQGLYILSKNNPPTDGRVAEISPLPPAEAVGILLAQDFSLPLLERAQLAQLLDILSQMTGALPVWRLSLAPELARLPEAVCAILSHQKRHGPTPQLLETRTNKT